MNDRIILFEILIVELLVLLSEQRSRIIITNMLDVAIDAAKKGGDLAYWYFKTHPKVTYKPDNSPVTKADIEVEKLIRKIITKNFPDHGIIGEELPPVNPKAKYQWVIDPIDGTKRFSIGHPYWSILIAVLENFKPVVGISFFPATNELFQARKGKGSYLNGKNLQVSKTSKLEKAFLITGALSHFSKISKEKQLLKLIKSCRSNGGDGYSVGHNFLLKGKVDICMETGNLYDFVAPAFIVKEAGGRYSDFSGNEDLNSGTCLLTNGLLHDQVLSLLNS